MPKPNFFIVGAPKCGTTALSEYLREHPNVFMCTPKEPHYFATDMPKYRVVNTEKEYLALFDEVTPDHLAIGEASVWYLYSKEAIKNIKKYNANSKIIVMLRNPVDLIYSMHSQSLYSMNEDEKDFQRAWELSAKRKKGFNNPKECKDIKVLFYDDVAKLGEQVERLMAVFPLDQIKIIFSEDFFSNTGFIYKEVLKFLGLPDDHRRNFPVINQNKRHMLEWAGGFTQHPPKKILNFYFFIKKAVGFKGWSIVNALRKINTKKVKRKPLSSDFKKQLLQECSADIDKLSQLTNRNLDHWLDL